MKAGKLEIKLECCICSSEIAVLNYAIRDSQKEETYAAWAYRHIKSFLTFGLKRPDPKKFLPVCPKCVEEIEGINSKRLQIKNSLSSESSKSYSYGKINQC